MTCRRCSRARSSSSTWRTGAAPAHAADVEGLTPQIEQLGEDLGNSVNGSEDSQPKPLVSLGAETATIQRAEWETNIAPVQPVPGTFRAEAEQQIAAGQKP